MLYLILINIVLLLVIGYLIYKFQKFKYESALQRNKDMADARADALKKSRATIKGQLSEQLVPFFKGFPYNASDLKFFGNPIDYICVVNMAEARDTDIPIKEIVFMDIKTGKSVLTPVERKIKDAIINGRVEWETITIQDDGSVKISRASKNKNNEEERDSIQSYKQE